VWTVAVQEKGGEQVGMWEKGDEQAGMWGMEELGFVLSAILYPWSLVRAIVSAMNRLK